jgi:hypothetical protein
MEYHGNELEHIFERRRIMKQFGRILLLMLATCSAVFAQPGDRREKIHAIKVGYITDKINLTPGQAEKFWPVYNRYEQEWRQMRQEFKKKYPKDNNSMNEHDSKKFIEDNLEVREARLNLEKKYKNEFLKVISAQQLAALYQAEREFKQMLIQNLKERHGKMEQVH